MKLNTIVTVALLIISMAAFGQSKNTVDNLGIWHANKHKSASLRTDIPTTQAQNLTVDISKLKAHLRGKSKAITLNIPHADGEFVPYTLTPASAMAPGLAAKFPEIQVFNGISADGKSHGKFDLTAKGFHGMMFTPQGTMFIDPINNTSQVDYQSYYKKDFEAYKKTPFGDDQLKTEINTKDTKVNLAAKQTVKQRSNGTELRKYRLAVTATGEYTQFHGGTKQAALSAIVTTINRINGIYEKEVAITFELIADNDLIIYTSAATDPYTNDDAGAYIDETQNNIDAIIGDANYDIGHGFSTGAGGLAGTGPCITGRKATGVTGTSSPIGDPYDVDYVAHEIGHQFSANHTFNGTTGSCDGSNRNGSTAYEPGSGTTILAYAGICAPQNIQNNSDAYFHTASYDEIITYSTLGSGNNCPTITATGNTPPEVNAGDGGFTIPISTPFTLTGSGTDADGDELTFAWEQFDLGPAGTPNSPVDNAPLFRSFSPVSTLSRTFPKLSDILNNNQIVGEILPDYTRTLTFRLTARDNQPTGGGVNYDEISFEVTDQAGPFVVSSFNTNTSIEAQNNITIEWDVANTDIAPVNCQFVNILLSEDGGNTFTHVLKSNTPNDGAEVVLIPDVVTSEARIKVEAADNIFFDINNANFQIVVPTVPDFNISLSEEEIDICTPATAEIIVAIGSIAGFSEEVTFSLNGDTRDITATFSSASVVAGNTATLTLEDETSSINETRIITVEATANGTTKSANITVNFYDGIIEEIVVVSPSDGQTDFGSTNAIIWNTLTGFNNYELQIATDNNFDTIIEETTSSTGSYNPTNLAEGTNYFLRIRAVNACETTAYTAVSFTTSSSNCTTLVSTDVPKAISSSGTPTVTSTIQINESGIISDLNVLDIQGTHTWVNDLTFTITSPSGTSVTLVSEICAGSIENFNFSFDDQAGTAIIPCPPTDGGTYIPLSDLSAFNGEQMNGTWTLTINDAFDVDGGSLNAWSLEICTNAGFKPNPPSNVQAESINGQIDLQWTDNSEDESLFTIERSTNNSVNFEEIATVGANVTSYSDLDISSNNNYYYRVAAVASGNYSNYSSIVSVVTIQLAPVNLTLSNITSSTMVLTWEDNNPTTDNFIVERAQGNGTFTQVANLAGGVLNYEDPNLDPETEYSYRVKSIFDGVESAFSNIVSAFTLPLPPIAPSGLNSEFISLSRLSLNWIDNSNNEDEFVIERSQNNNVNFIEIGRVNEGITQFDDISATEVDNYFYRVKAINTGGESDYSNESFLSISPISPTNLSLSLISLQQINLTWDDNAINEVEFVIERSKADNTNFIELARVAANSIAFEDITLEEPNIYFYRVKAINEGGDSDYSNEANASSLILSTELVLDDLVVYPNPSNGYFSIDLSPNQENNLQSAVIYDAVGSAILKLGGEELGDIKQINIADKPSGIYYLHLNFQQNTVVKKLVKI